jgi:hypothetical protein
MVVLAETEGAVDEADRVESKSDVFFFFSECLIVLSNKGTQREQ